MKKKALLIAVGIGGLALAAYFIIKGRKGGTIPDTIPDGNGGGGGIYPTIAGLDYAEMADDIHSAMDGYGTSEDLIENQILKLRNKADWDALVATYGVRTVSSGRGNIFQDDFTGTLPQALKNELDEDEMADLNAKLRKIGVSL
ncbi:MAG: hypothetical protein FJZ56_02765 [Chlamydiae bacterium]|nr:hypothetical protein [Chlamydiota bacterium]